MKTQVSPAEFWNEYWTKRLSETIKYRHTLWMMNTHLWGMELLRERNAKRILMPGNGCSLMPHALKHLGFEVVVVDISEVANRFVSETEATPQLLARFFPEYRKEKDEVMGEISKWDEEASLRRVEREAQAGGNLSVITADIGKWEPDTPVNAIYDDRAMMIMPQSEWPDIAARYSRWLSADGIALVLTLNLGGMMGQDVSGVGSPFEYAFRKAGFQEQEEREVEVVTRWACVFTRTETKTIVITPPHGKLVRFIHGSG